MVYMQVIYAARFPFQQKKNKKNSTVLQDINLKIERQRKKNPFTNFTHAKAYEKSEESGRKKINAKHYKQ